MPYVDDTPPAGVSAPSDNRMTTTQDHLPTVGPTFPSTWKSEGCTTPDSPHLSKGHPNTALWQPHQQHGAEMMPEHHREKGRKRKCQDEGGVKVGSKEPAKARNQGKQDQGDIDLLYKQPGKGQIWKTQVEALIQLPGEGTRGPQEEGTIKVKSDGGKGHKRPYCVLEERVQKRKNKTYRKLLEHLERHDHVNSDSNSDDTSPKDILKT